VTRLEVALSGENGYEIQVGSGLLGQAGEALALRARSRRIVVVTQPRIAHRWSEPLLTSLAAASFDVSVVVFPAGERHKHLQTIARLYERLYNLPGIDRRTLLVALGGGVVGDVVGFVAATYLRGLDYVQVPTTLLAMVDSSVGGKTGVDFRAGKNLVGAFHQPRLVLSDVETLTTLPRREVRSGLAEVVKYGIIREPALLERLQESAGALRRGEGDIFEELVQRSCAIKAEVVAGDEREESGLRATLNFGHTIGHALESATDYRRYKHGEAVAIGMVSASLIGEEAGITPPEVTRTLKQTLVALGLPTELPDDIEDAHLMELTERDKKAVGGVARYVLARRAGETIVQEVGSERVAAALARQRREGKK
jgi:3-dehydroquinate synthase